MEKKKRNYKRFWALLKKVYARMEQEEAKCLVARQVSQGRTESLRELTDREWRNAMKWLVESDKEQQYDLRRERSSALHQLQRYGVDTTNWNKVNAFVSQPRIAGKPFYALSRKELEALTRKMRAINAKKVTSDSVKSDKRNNVNVIFIPNNKKVYGN